MGEFTYIDISSVKNGVGIVNYENKILSENAPIIGANKKLIEIMRSKINVVISEVWEQ